MDRFNLLCYTFQPFSSEVFHCIDVTVTLFLNALKKEYRRFLQKNENGQSATFEYNVPL